MSDDPIDLSALDTSRDGGRWDEAVQRTMQRVEAVLLARAQRDDPFSLIARWRRPVLAAVAAVVVVVLPAEWALERREEGAERVRSLAQLSGEALRGGRPPTGAELLGTVSPWRLR